MKFSDTGEELRFEYDVANKKMEQERLDEIFDISTPLNRLEKALILGQ